MEHTTIKQYLQHYGKIRSLRGSVIRSTFRRVTVVFDKYDEPAAKAAMSALDPQYTNTLKCVFCKEKATCWDHLHPAADGGTHQIKNLAPTCTACNNEKGGRDWRTYLTAKGRPHSDLIWATLEAHTDGYMPRGSFLDQASEQPAFDELLNEIHAKMEQADEIVFNSMIRQNLL